MQGRFLFLGSISAAIAVVLGAFGAHAVRERLGPQMLAVLETGVRYQMFHALAMLAVGLLERRTSTEGGEEWGRARSSSLLASSGALFVAGTLLFSGSLYLLTLTGARWLGSVTALGGICFLGGWLLLALAVIRPS